MRPERLLLSDMLDAIREIQSFISGVTLDTFIVNTKTRSAVLYQLIVVGEAAARLPDDLKQRHPEIDWGPVVAFRNRVVRGYFALDWSIVWNAANVDIRTLEPLIASIISSEFTE